MSKKIRDFELMSTSEICCQLRISSRTLDRYRKRPSDNNPFPEPDCSYMGGSNKWLKTKVTAWQIKEMSRSTRKPMSHLNLVRDELGKLRRPENF
ncbi:excisionase Xis [Salmonella enterica]|nr:excisionase Xis [Salmonella enterica]ECC3801563.1 excisionase Xis [Salmonella enterica subsp. enterica]EDQ6232178.1 excisionase Xis [Salmonella enterica subsp. enterica serovar Tucson]EGF6397736.1 excisionase Xis [Salmonella enterica subsp. enterica serovar Rottnest]EID4361823.1 excisionase Xis [Salmonella enterica subsp. enterica serovar Muenchen]